MSALESITTWITCLRDGNPKAAQPLWEAYFQRLVGLARHYLSNNSSGLNDEEDLALSAIQSAFRGIEEGKFPRLTDRDDLWSLLARITRNKSIDAWRHAQKSPVVASEAQLEEILDTNPTPEMAAQFSDECRSLLARLKDENLANPTFRGEDLHRIALLKLDGVTNKVIAATLQCPLRRIERRLVMIRALWQQDT